MMYDWLALPGIGAVNVLPDTPVPENVPELPEPGCAPVTGTGTAESVRDWPWHMLAEDEVIERLLFCCSVTVIEEEPPGWQAYWRMSSRA